MENWFRERILYDGPLDVLLEEVCKRYEIGPLDNYSVIENGYQDLNIELETEEGSFLAKLFAKTKSDEDCRRYVEIMREARDSGVNFPELIPSKGEYLESVELGGVRTRLCLMEFIEGETLNEPERGIKDHEIEFVARQAAKINRMEVKPHMKYDSWSVENFLYEFRKCHRFLDEEDEELIRPLIQEFREVDVEKLPHCFVHNDLRETNIIRGEDGELWILDFGVSDIYPRIQEIAVTASSLLYTSGDAEMQRRTEIFLEEYKKNIQLTEEELELLDLFIDVAVAMEVIRPTFEKKAKGNRTEENAYWLKNGRRKLRERRG
jgi:Ser/Thr protein kinase RdoA (MazF antagonist)